MMRGRVTTAVARAAAAALLLAAAGCTDVVNAGKIVAPQTVDAADTASPPVDGAKTVEEICTSTGGHVEVHACCNTADFAPLCFHGLCCDVGAPVPLQDVKLCVCPVHYCFSPTARGPGTRAGCYPEVMSTDPPDGSMSAGSMDAAVDGAMSSGG